MPSPNSSGNIDPKEWKAMIDAADDTLAAKYLLDQSRVRNIYHRLDAAK